jgi:hypothetical protein
MHIEEHKSLRPERQRWLKGKRRSEAIEINKTPRTSAATIINQVLNLHPSHHEFILFILVIKDGTKVLDWECCNSVAA